MKKSALLATLSVCGVALATLALLSKGSFIAASARIDGPERTVEFIKGDLTNVHDLEDGYFTHTYTLSHSTDDGTDVISSIEYNETTLEGSYMYLPAESYTLPGQEDDFLIELKAFGGDAPMVYLYIPIFEDASLNLDKSGFVYSSNFGHDHALAKGSEYDVFEGEGGIYYTSYYFHLEFTNYASGNTITIHELKLVYNC